MSRSKACLAVCLAALTLNACSLNGPSDLEAPKALTATVTELEYIHVTWEAVPGCQYYDLYYAEKADGPFSLLKADIELVMSYRDAGLPPFTTRSYHVKAKKASGEGPASPASAVVTGRTVSSSPIGLTCSKTVQTLTLSWTAIDRADRYKVYRCSSTPTSAWELVGESTISTYEIRGATAEKCRYTVTACLESFESERGWGVIAGLDELSPVHDLSIVYEEAAIKFSWMAVSGADTYIVEYNDCSAVKGSTTVETTTASVRIPLAELSNDIWEFSVSPRRQGTLSGGTGTLFKYIYAKPIEAYAEQRADLIYISWLPESIQKVSLESLAIVHRATALDGPYSVIAVVPASQKCWDMNANPGVSYYYKVSLTDGAYATPLGKASAAVSITASVTIKSADPSTASAEGQSLQLYWTNTSPADAFDVYRASAPEGEYQKIATVSANGYRDVGLPRDTVLFYKVLPSWDGNAFATLAATESAAMRTWGRRPTFLAVSKNLGEYIITLPAAEADPQVVCYRIHCLEDGKDPDQPSNWVAVVSGGTSLLKPGAFVEMPAAAGKKYWFSIESTFSPYPGNFDWSDRYRLPVAY